MSGNKSNGSGLDKGKGFKRRRGGEGREENDSVEGRPTAKRRGSQSSDSLDNNFPQDLRHYVLTLGRNNSPSQYIITDDYKSVLEELLREPKIILKGPKGCGKSLLLLKLFSDFIREDKQILYLSARTLNIISVKGSMKYFEGSFLQLEGEKCSSHDNF